ncbi:ribosome biogenesis protein wdr12-like [Convolutriloba macropyga]|uniref:ribosome biogenesis protein wdr12-like n=1 Tax=Convolutriloba macropyga TaxID=536237 RepID=UPI003F528029
MEPVNDLQYPALLQSSCNELQLKPTEVYLPSSTTDSTLLQLFKTFVDVENIPYEVDFLIDGKLLRDSLLEHFTAFNISTEQPVKVELIRKTSAPERKPDINADDWITSISEYRNSLLFGCADGSVCYVKDGESKTLFKTKFSVQSIDINNSMIALASRSSTLEVLQLNEQAEEKNATLKWQLKGHSGPIAKVSFEPTSERLASVGQDGMLKIWSTIEQQENDEIETKEVPKKRSKMSQLEESDNRSEVKQRVPLVTLQAHQEQATVCIWCRDKYSHEIITAGFDNNLKVYDLNSLKARASYTRDRPYNTANRSLKNYLVATCCFDTKIRIYDVRAENEVMVVQSADAHDEMVSCLNWSEDNENLFISGSYDSLVKMWDFRSPKVPLYDIKTSEGKVLDCLWSEDDVYFGGEDCKLYCFSNSAR